MYRKTAIVPALLFLAPSLQAEPASPRDQAHEVLTAAIDAYLPMMKQVDGLTARISTARDVSLRGSPHVRASAAGLQEAGSPARARMTWTTDLMWDRASGNSVASTTRTQHAVDGINQLPGQRPTIYYSVNGMGMGYYSTVRTSIESEGWRPPLDEDIVIVKDFTSMTEIGGVRMDRFLAQIRDWYLTPEEEGRNATTVERVGDRTVVTIVWSKPDGSVEMSFKLAFSEQPFGPALEECVQHRGDGGWSRTQFQIRDVSTDGSPTVHLPVGSSLTTGVGEGESEIVHFREERAAEIATLKPGGFSLSEIREEVSLRYGVAAADTMDELLRAVPATRAQVE